MRAPAGAGQHRPRCYHLCDHGKRLKRPVEITATQFSGILPSLQAGTIDFVAAPVTVTKERAENYLFTEGYLNTDYQFLTKKGEPAIGDLKQLKGKVVSVNKGSAYDSWARGLEAEIGWTVESFGTQTDAVHHAVAQGAGDQGVLGSWHRAQDQRARLQAAEVVPVALLYGVHREQVEAAGRDQPQHLRALQVEPGQARAVDVGAHGAEGAENQVAFVCGRHLIAP